MDEQPFPEDAACPECGGEPTPESKRKHHLQSLGYLADDGHPECRECGAMWRIGRPIGEFEGGDDLWCESCDSRYMRVHFIKLMERGGSIRHYKLNLKCPNPECVHYDTVRRESDASGRALVGYPDITGTTEGADPVGWTDRPGE